MFGSFALLEYQAKRGERDFVKLAKQIVDRIGASARDLKQAANNYNYGDAADALHQFRRETMISKAKALLGLIDVFRGEVITSNGGSADQRIELALLNHDFTQGADGSTPRFEDANWVLGQSGAWCENYALSVIPETEKYLSIKHGVAI